MHQFVYQQISKLVQHATMEKNEYKSVLVCRQERASALHTNSAPCLVRNEIQREREKTKFAQRERERERGERRLLKVTARYFLNGILHDTIALDTTKLCDAPAKTLAQQPCQL
jgi:hypothetical protein